MIMATCSKSSAHKATAPCNTYFSVCKYVFRPSIVIPTTPHDICSQAESLKIRLFRSDYGICLMFALVFLELLRCLPNRLLCANVEVVRRAGVHELRPDTSDGHLGQRHASRHGEMRDICSRHKPINMSHPNII